MKKNFYLLMFLIHIKLAAQNPTPTIDMYPKTPDAAAASKFADIPAGNYTGVANFTIPLYTINSGGYQIPIELQYTTTGVKVSEIASRVGLGWSLNVGASLSQQIYGKPDNSEKFKKYTINSTASPIPIECSGDPLHDLPLCEAFLSAIGSTASNGLKADLLPDVFSYQLLDKSGKFIYDFSGEFGIPMPYNQLKIKPVRGTFGDDVEITGENGIKYIFINTPFDLEYFSSCQSPNLSIDPDFTPLYNIKSIEFPNKNIIEYKYLKSINSTFISSILEQENIYNMKSTATAPWYTLPPKKCVNKTHSREKILSEINFSDGKIYFYYNNDQDGLTENPRQDLIGDVYLTRVVVKSLSDETIKDISLIYNYFDSPHNDNNYPEDSDEYPDTFKRLKLVSVKDNKTQGEYKLSYYGEDTGKTLPNRLSYSQDFWGVYNGQPNTTGIATVKVKRWSYQNIYDVYIGANKQPDINFGIIGNLQKMQYPSGGYTKITYEADDYIKNENAPPVYNYIEKFSNYAFLNDPVNFDIPEGNIYNKEIILYDSDCNEYTTGEATDGDPRWELKRLTVDPKTFSGWMCTKTVDRSSDIAASYRLNIIQPAGLRNSRELEAKYHWIEEITVDASETRKTGTIRVKQIENYSLDNGKITRQYTYVDPGTGKSSGKNAGEELFVALSYNEIPLPPLGSYGYGNYAMQLNRVNNPGWQINTVRGKSVGYDYVQEIYVSSLDPSRNYKKQQKFKNDIVSYIPYQYTSAVNVDWPTLDLDRGLILEETSFDGNGNRIRDTKFDYDNGYYFNQYATMNYFDYPANVSTPFIAQAAVVKMKTYDLSPVGGKNYHLNSYVFHINNIWIKNVKTTTTDYKDNQPVLVTEQTTAYSINSGQNRHTFPEIRTTSTLGSNISTTQHFKYAHDVNNYLKEKNIISIPLEIETTRTSDGITKTLSKTATLYPASQQDADSSTSGLPLPKRVTTYNNLTGDPATEITYDKYDNKGNLLQYTTKDGVPVAIIWGYDQTRPIAKIEGGAYAQVSSLASAIISASDSDASQPPGNDETALLTALDNFRKAPQVKDYQVTTYTYDPLIGVRSITPPSGVREYYYYDTAGRLESVKTKDDSGSFQTLKEYQYHYKP